MAEGSDCCGVLVSGPGVESTCGACEAYATRLYGTGDAFMCAGCVRRCAELVAEEEPPAACVPAYVIDARPMVAAAPVAAGERVAVGVVGAVRPLARRAADPTIARLEDDVRDLVRRVDKLEAR